MRHARFGTVVVIVSARRSDVSCSVVSGGERTVAGHPVYPDHLLSGVWAWGAGPHLLDAVLASQMAMEGIGKIEM